MYTVELDCHVAFTPPMHEDAPGVVTTRTFELPFPPTEGLHVHGPGWDCMIDDPHGFRIKHVVWDIDREVFLATTHLTHDGLPVAEIASELADWIARGWKFGSYNDAYQQHHRRRHTPGPLASAACRLHETMSSDEMENLHTLPPESRPDAFNALFKAIVRHMAAHYLSESTAYAMDTTGRFLGEHRKQREIDSAESCEWGEALSKFARMPWDDKYDWTLSTKKYPTIESLVCKPKRQPAEKVPA